MKKRNHSDKHSRWTTVAMSVCLTVFLPLTSVAQKQWTLDDCISYAMQNNITLKQAQLTKQSATEDRKQSQAALLPSLSASTNLSLSGRGIKSLRVS